MKIHPCRENMCHLYMKIQHSLGSVIIKRFPDFSCWPAFALETRAALLALLHKILQLLGNLEIRFYSITQLCYYLSKLLTSKKNRAKNQSFVCTKPFRGQNFCFCFKK